jgi:uncharacterized protein
MTSTNNTIARIANALQLPAANVAAVVALLDDKATVPFIARYRKERTGGLDEVQIRDIDVERERLSTLDDRRSSILKTIAEQQQLTPELERRLGAASTLHELEDLYLPYKQKRRTRAAMARERGLQPLADRIVAQARSGNPRADATLFVNDEVKDVDAALAGAADIVAEQFADKPEVRRLVRETFARDGVLVSKKAKPKDATPTRFDTWADFSEPAAQMPSHRYLALVRGEAEGVLKLDIDVDARRIGPQLERLGGVQSSSPWAPLLVEAIKDAYKRLLVPSAENELRTTLKERADAEAIGVFANNLDSVLLAPPVGPRAVIGIDPGLRTGCKCVAVDETGRFLDTITIYPSRGSGAERQAADALLAFVAKYTPFAVGVGNGTGGRETEAFVRSAIKAAAPKFSDVIVTPVNEAGASVYSASDIAREEFPDLDLTIRGAISIARRLQDPLAELVKLDPKVIGVGQYQHDVHQPSLAKKLDEVVESCVNRVGVDLNTASASLLQHVAGVGPTLAKRIVQHREEHGVFTKRAGLKDVKGVGERTFEQAAGFVRVRGAQPLDASGVHPERYPLVQQMAKDLGVPLDKLVGDAALAATIPLQRYVSDDVGLPTLKDIVAELSKPGRDPRAAFEPPAFRDDVNTIDDLEQGMVLSGVVTNVTAFGAFVDIGVHQDGLVHVSQLSNRFVKNPADVVKPGDRLQVRVVEVDRARARIALSARLTN